MSLSANKGTIFSKLFACGKLCLVTYGSGTGYNPLSLLRKCLVLIKYAIFQKFSPAANYTYIQSRTVVALAINTELKKISRDLKKNFFHSCFNVRPMRVNGLLQGIFWFLHLKLSLGANQFQFQFLTFCSTSTCSSFQNNQWPVLYKKLLQYCRTHLTKLKVF